MYPNWLRGETANLECVGSNPIMHSEKCFENSDVAQWLSAALLHGEGCEFESHHCYYFL